MIMMSHFTHKLSFLSLKNCTNAPWHRPDHAKVERAKGEIRGGIFLICTNFLPSDRNNKWPSTTSTVTKSTVLTSCYENINGSYVTISLPISHSGFSLSPCGMLSPASSLSSPFCDFDSDTRTKFPPSFTPRIYGEKRVMKKEKRVRDGHKVLNLSLRLIVDV